MKHVVIVGAGGAGLCLLEQLFRQSKTPLRITIVDADPESHRNRTWCSWLPTDGLEPYHSTHWRRIQVATPGYQDILHPRQLVYAYAAGTDVHDHVMSLNDGRHEVKWIRRRATGFGYDGPGQAHVYSGKERVTGDWVFTSWYPGQRTESDLWQHFHGWMVETEHPVFEPDTMTLMDFTVPQAESGLLFAYVLPFDETVALVELTAFSANVWPKERYEARLEAHMRARYQLEPGQYRIRTVETGRIPMEPVRFPGQPNPATFPIGTISGAVKPSTGYAFERMRRSASHLVRTMLREGRPRYLAPSPSRFKLYDLLLLRILKERPEHGIAIFRSLFKKVPIDVVFGFLDESTRLRQEIGIFRRLPLAPFLRSLWRHVTS